MDLKDARGNMHMVREMEKTNTEIVREKRQLRLNSGKLQSPC